MISQALDSLRTGHLAPLIKAVVGYMRLKAGFELEFGGNTTCLRIRSEKRKENSRGLHGLCLKT